jgi:hypothetical protein
VPQNSPAAVLPQVHDPAAVRSIETETPGAAYRGYKPEADGRYAFTGTL